MTQLMFDPVYKRTKKEGFVIWQVETQDGTGNVLITYGNVNGNPHSTIKAFPNKLSALNHMTKVRNKKKSEGLYHTLSELNITVHIGGELYSWKSMNNLPVYGTLDMALDAKLPRLTTVSKTSKQKLVKPEPIEKINLNVPITIHLPRF